MIVNRISGSQNNPQAFCGDKLGAVNPKKAIKALLEIYEKPLRADAFVPSSAAESKSSFLIEMAEKSIKKTHPAA